MLNFIFSHFNISITINNGSFLRQHALTPHHWNIQYCTISGSQCLAMKAIALSRCPICGTVIKKTFIRMFSHLSQGALGPIMSLTPQQLCTKRQTTFESLPSSADCTRGTTWSCFDATNTWKPLTSGSRKPVKNTATCRSLVTLVSKEGCVVLYSTIISQLVNTLIIDYP